MPGKPLRAGKLRQQIAVQQNLVPTQDSFGQMQPNWTTVQTVWGSIEPKGGRRYWNASELQAETSHLITIRYYPGLRPENYRLQWTDSNGVTWTYYLVDVTTDYEVPNRMNIQAKVTASTGWSVLQQLAKLPGLTNWWQARLSASTFQTSGVGLVDSIGGKNTTGSNAGNNCQYYPPGSADSGWLNNQPAIYTSATGLTTPAGTWGPIAGGNWVNSWSMVCVVAGVAGTFTGSMSNPDLADDGTDNNVWHTFGPNEVRARLFQTGTIFDIPFSLQDEVPNLFIWSYDVAANLSHVRVNGVDCGTAPATVETQNGPTGTLNIAGGAAGAGIGTQALIGDFMLFNGVAIPTGTIAAIEAGFLGIYEYTA